MHVVIELEHRRTDLTGVFPWTPSSSPTSNARRCWPRGRRSASESTDLNASSVAMKSSTVSRSTLVSAHLSTYSCHRHIFSFSQCCLMLVCSLTAWSLAQHSNSFQDRTFHDRGARRHKGRPPASCLTTTLFGSSLAPSHASMPSCITILPIRLKSFPLCSHIAVPQPSSRRILPPFRRVLLAVSRLKVERRTRWALAEHASLGSYALIVAAKVHLD